MVRWCLLLPALLLTAGVASASEDTIHTVNGDDVHVRSGPGMQHPVVATLDRETWVVVVGAEGRWKKARVPGGFACYVHERLITTKDDVTATVNANRVLLRATPDKEHAALSTRLERGEELSILGRSGEWVKVIPPERTTAWIFDRYLKELGPADEYRAALARATEKRRKALLGDAPERAARERAAKERAGQRKTVLDLGAEVLDGRGDVAEQERRLLKIALECDDDLTRGYASALLSLVALRKDTLRLEDRLAKLSKERAEEVEKVREELEAARQRYEDAKRLAASTKRQREAPFRAVGTIEKREDAFVLVEDGRVAYRLESKRFRLEDYVGKRVGVNGRVVVTDVDRKRSHLLVEKMEIRPGKKTRRPDR